MTKEEILEDLKLADIRETGDRKKLNEGRDHQMGFTLMKKWNSENKYTTLYPFSCCKDYLNDWAFTSKTRIPIKSYGVVTRVENLFDKEGYFYLGVRIQRKWGATSDYETMGRWTYPEGWSKPKVWVEDYGPLSVDRERLKKNSINILSLLNWVNDTLGVRQTQLDFGIKDTIIFKTDKFWLQYAYRISMYALLVRMSQFWDGKGTPLEFLEAYDKSLDSEQWATYKPQMLKLLKKEIPMPEFDLTSIKESDLKKERHQWGEFLSYNNIHNAGFRHQIVDEDWKKYLKS